VRRPEILLVEDNPGDVRLVREALAESGGSSRLHTVGDGAEALAFVRREGAYADAPRPDLILLDLNLPRVDGRQMLAELADADGLRHIPVVVLTTSARDEDVAACRDRARAFITKPDDLDAYIDVLRWIDQLARARGRVLVVDDDRAHRERLEQQLIEHGFEVATATGDTAAAAAERFAPDVVLAPAGVADGADRLLPITRGEPPLALAGRIREQISRNRALG
jgi:CheY-like chemotaxis protein